MKVTSSGSKRKRANSNECDPGLSLPISHGTIVGGWNPIYHPALDCSVHSVDSQI